MVIYYNKNYLLLKQFIVKDNKFFDTEIIIVLCHNVIKNSSSL